MYLIIGMYNTKTAPFFDVRVFNSFAESNQSPCQAATFQRHERDKCRTYEECIRETERT